MIKWQIEHFKNKTDSILYTNITWFEPRYGKIYIENNKMQKEIEIEKDDWVIISEEVK